MGYNNTSNISNDSLYNIDNNTISPLDRNYDGDDNCNDKNICIDNDRIYTPTYMKVGNIRRKLNDELYISYVGERRYLTR